MTTTNNAPRPDVSDMFAVHQALRDTLSCAPQLINKIDATDLKRVDLITNFYDNVLSFLHVHHDGEEKLIFPLLRDRCPEELSVIEQMLGQHANVTDLLGWSGQALAAWADGDTTAQTRAATNLSELGAELYQHLDDEEREVLPLCAEHLTPEEWAALPGHAMANFGGDKAWLILGLVRQRMTQAQRDEMLAHMPAPAVEMWTTMGEPSFTNLMAEVGAPLR
jgi:hemerythrin-like domain-containing protein